MSSFKFLMHEGELIPLILKDRDILCPGCGYNLRDVRERRCPECGAWLSVHPQAVCLTSRAEHIYLSPRRGLFWMTAAGLIVGTIGLVLMSLGIVTSPGQRLSMDMWKMLILGGAVVHPVLLLGLFRLRVRMERLAKWVWVVFACLGWWWAIAPAGAIVWMVGAGI